MKFSVSSLGLALPLSLVLALSPGVLHGETFAANSSTSEVMMTLKTNHDIVHGTFHIDSGSIEFAPGTPKMSGKVVVAAGSAKTGNDGRDKKMNKEILKVDEYRTITFVPKSYTGNIAATGDSTIQVAGAMTLLGMAHEMTIPMTVHMEGDTTTVKSHFVVPYVEWGLKKPDFLVWKADKDVDINLKMVGKVTK